MRVLITAGNTRERIDDVRDWGNIFTGNTGYSIAKALAQVADVDLLTSNAQHLAELAGKQTTPHRITGSSFKTHEELRGALAALTARNKYDAIFMTAAVADYKPAQTFAVVERRPDASATGLEHWVVKDVQAGKVKSSYPNIAILGEQTEKIVDLFRGEWGFKGLLVKFKLEVGVTPQKLIEVGQASRKASGADYLVANTLAMVNGEAAGAYLLSDAGEEWVPRAELPQKMASLVKARSAGKDTVGATPASPSVSAPEVAFFSKGRRVRQASPLPVKPRRRRRDCRRIGEPSLLHRLPRRLQPFCRHRLRRLQLLREERYT